MSKVLILGGTAWLGRELARQAAARGDEVVCLARGAGGGVPAGAQLIKADRERPDAYDQVAATDWDLVIDVSRQPGQVRGAVRAMAERAGHWVFVSTCSVYADHSRPGVDESDGLLPALEGDVARVEQYGEGKVACEQACLDALGDRVVLARVGLIGGGGDESDRFGYWPGRFARDAGPVLVPDAADQTTQTIDVGDLAAWLLLAGDERLSGPYNVLGEEVPFGEVLELARAAAGFAGEVVPAPGEWLQEQGVEPWMGPRSLPLWLPGADYAGFMSRSVERAVADGLTRRPPAETVEQALAEERERGLDRDRKAGLTPAEEQELLAALG
ncbi:Rossmann-fold NAD(P)-binding domain-containing protein [Microlunatus parietis]|uniref:Nucleoside-diphosphate-sugar epimerase n=1 Tax=Microlunatus parietis TaxID=682979 RepID=A0A7Y9LB66_9ACTN|nr:oxidoreductase [Microlunatus parietis]NYE73574.1 nucleoside-diphosphate-sugar epimerase [Microlunatus parietis]